MALVLAPAPSGQPYLPTILNCRSTKSRENHGVLVVDLRHRVVVVVGVVVVGSIARHKKNMDLLWVVVVVVAFHLVQYDDERENGMQ